LDRIRCHISSGIVNFFNIVVHTKKLALCPQNYSPQNFPSCKVSATKVRKKKGKHPSVREGTRQQSICVLCKQPITRRQRPSVRLQPGKEAHMECFIKRELDADKPN